jgi:hypothetical protein
VEYILIISKLAGAPGQIHIINRQEEVGHEDQKEDNYMA